MISIGTPRKIEPRISIAFEENTANELKVIKYYDSFNGKRKYQRGMFYILKCCNWSAGWDKAKLYTSPHLNFLYCFLHFLSFAMLSQLPDTQAHFAKSALALLGQLTSSKLTTGLSPNT